MFLRDCSLSDTILGLASVNTAVFGKGLTMRILLVEDESKVARFIARGLSADCFAVDTAADGNFMGRG